MKLSTCFAYTLLSISAPTLYSWDVKTNSSDTHNEAIQNFLEGFSPIIVKRCNFTPDTPIYVPLSDADLMSWLEQKDVAEGTRQYLLLKSHYKIDDNIVIYPKSKLCGLNDWLVSGIPALTDLLGMRSFSMEEPEEEVDYSGSGDLSGNFSGSQYNENPNSGSHYDCTSAALNFSDEFRNMSCQKKALTRLSFSTKNQDAPSLLIYRNTELRHLELYQESNPSQYGLVASGCFLRDYCRNIWANPRLTLSDVVLEDKLGFSEFLLLVDDASKFFADNVTVNFTHNDFSSSAFNFYWTEEIQINNLYMNNYGARGTSVFWDGILRANDISLISNAVIRSFGEGDIIGFKLIGDTRAANNRLPRFSGITIESDINVGFLFDSKFRINPEGNIGNVWNSNGHTRCTGSDYNCALIFGDGASDSEPVTTFIPTATAIPVPGENVQSGAANLSYQSVILASLLGTLLTLYNIL